MGKFLDATKGEIMSDNNLDKEVTVQVIEETKKASKKTEAVVEPVAQDAPVIEEAVVTEEVVGFVAPTASTGTTYNIWAPWDTAQNGDLLSYNTTVNSKDWAGAVVYQLGQYNTAQRGF
jgi:hypothetical protein